LKGLNTLLAEGVAEPGGISEKKKRGKAQRKNGRKVTRIKSGNESEGEPGLCNPSLIRGKKRDVIPVMQKGKRDQAENIYANKGWRVYKAPPMLLKTDR